MGTYKRLVWIVCLTLVVAWGPGGAWSEPFTTVRNNGDSANRVDIAILGDGYRASELAKYATDVETLIQGLFAQEPLREYQRYFNVHRVDVTSTQSGADHPERVPPVSVNTALGATYNCAGIQRLICVDIAKVNSVASASLTPERRDIILVLVNDTEYGGSGGAVAVASVNTAAVEVILHELGHSFALLADEYGGPPPPACNSSIEPSEVNATRETKRALIKWNTWINASTAIPTTGTQTGVAGLYAGAKYCDTALSRPTFSSKMRALGSPFEQINSEQLVKRIYNWASPIDSSEPGGPTITLAPGQAQAFRAHTPQPLTHSLNIVWKVDGQTKGQGETFTLQASGLTPGLHVVEVVVNDPTALVRNDPAQVLKESQHWNVTVSGNTLPNVPSGLGQFRSNGSTAIGVGGTTPEATVVLKGTVSDPNSGQTVKLQVEVRPLGTAFSNSATHESGLVGSGIVTSVTVSGLTMNTSYHWQARAVDNLGGASAWVLFGGNAESAIDFRVSNTPPNVPSGLGQFKSNGSTAIPVGGTTAETTVVLKGTVSDPDSGQTVKLQVEVRPLGTAFSNSATHESGLLGSGTVASVTVPGLVMNTSYHWQARAVDNLGAASAWVPFGGNAESAIDFRVSNTPPNVPTGLGQSKSNGSTAISVGGTTAETTVVLRGTVSDPDDGQTVQLQLEVRPLGTAFSNVPTHQSVLVNSGSVASASVTGLSMNTSYHWQARAVDNLGTASAWMPFGGNAESAIDFRVSNSSPNSSPNPPSGLLQLTSIFIPIAIGGATGETMVVLTGVMSDPDAGQTVKLQVEIRPLGTAFSNAATHQSGFVASGIYVYVSVPGLKVNTFYHWQARTVDSLGAASAWVPFGGNREDVADFQCSS